MQESVDGYTRGQRRTALRPTMEVYEIFPMLAERWGMLAGALSGRKEQMLAIGAALMARPTLLLLDEPSGGLASVVVAEVMDRIGGLKESGLAILLVEQAVEAAMWVADDVAVLDGGRLVLVQDASTVYRLERGEPFDTEPLVEALVDLTAASLLAATRLDPSLDVEEAVARLRQAPPR